MLCVQYPVATMASLGALWHTERILHGVSLLGHANFAGGLPPAVDKLFWDTNCVDSVGIGNDERSEKSPQTSPPRPTQKKNGQQKEGPKGWDQSTAESDGVRGTRVLSQGCSGLRMPRQRAAVSRGTGRHHTNLMQCFPRIAQQRDSIMPLEDRSRPGRPVCDLQ